VFDYLEGKLAERRVAHVVVDAGGVGYEVAVPLGVDFPARDGRVKVWTHLVVREDAHLLYGFPDQRLREVFRLLLQVRGVGPAVALAVLSTLPGDELLHAIAAQEAALFLRVKGVGKKTAEQILLDLREKAPRLLAEASADALVPRPRTPAGRQEDAVRALVSIGYSDKEARRSVERAGSKVDPNDLELLVRTALRE
jgi:Holliday junction DNA helicase RuvA